MKTRITQAEQNLLLLEKIIPEGEGLYVWAYSLSGNLIASSCPEEAFFDRAFRYLGGFEKARAAAGGSLPRVIGSAIGMQWAVTREVERQEEMLFVIGPVFYRAPQERALKEGLRGFPREAGFPEWERQLYERLPALPVMPYAVFSRYALMIHNALTGEQCGLEAFAPEPEAEGPVIRPDEQRDRTDVYRAEQALLKMVRNGDINYQEALQGSVRLSGGTPVTSRDPLRAMKTSITVFVTLVSRAAMEGGLSPEVAYELGDSYIQAAEDCRDSGELSAMTFTMYHDFIYRVHHLHFRPECSLAIRKCCDYIDLSLDKKIRVKDLAMLCGYTEYYLTEKFKKETGLSVSAYIRRARVERAKVMLTSTDRPVREIAERLAFNTVNYFIQCFKEETGVTPAQYRKGLLSS